MTPSPPEAAPGLLRLVGLPYFLVAFVARLPFSMMIVGVLTLVVSVRGSLGLGGLTSAAVGIGAAGFGPLLGAAADRFGQRRVLLLAAAAHAIALVGFVLVVAGPLPGGFVLAIGLLVGASGPQVSPMSRSRLVTIIAERMRGPRVPRVVTTTMAYESTAEETAFVFGPVLVGVLASFVHPIAPLVGAALLTAVFVTAFALHPSAKAIPGHRHAHGRAPSRVAELFRARVLVIVAGTFSMGLFFGSMLTSLTAFMEARGAAERAGLFFAVMGVGSALLALGVAWLPARFPPAARWLVFAAVLLGGTFLLPGVGSEAGMIVALALTGIGAGPALVTLFTLGADRSPAGRSATVMTMLGSAITLGQALAAAITGFVAASGGVVASLWLPVAAATLVVLAGLGNLVLTARENRQPDIRVSALRVGSARVPE